jgi:DNA-binding transcriptional ArsR family regulator
MSPPSAAPLFAALGDEMRLALLERLSAGAPLSIARLTAGLGITRQAVTKHLAVLAGAGFIRDARRGRERLWALDPARLAEAREKLDQISRQWDMALSRLQQFVEASES